MASVQPTVTISSPNISSSNATITRSGGKVKPTTIRTRIKEEEKKPKSRWTPDILAGTGNYAGKGSMAIPGLTNGQTWDQAAKEVGYDSFDALYKAVPKKPEPQFTSMLSSGLGRTALPQSGTSSFSTGNAFSNVQSSVKNSLPDVEKRIASVKEKVQNSLAGATPTITTTPGGTNTVYQKTTGSPGRSSSSVSSTFSGSGPVSNTTSVGTKTPGTTSSLKDSILKKIRDRLGARGITAPI